MPRFVHLHTHTEFSLIDGLVRIKPLIKAVQAAQMPACAVTDFSNLCGLVQFYKAANSAGIKPIIGSDILIDNGNEPPSHLVLLCQDKQGYINLSELVSLSYLEGLKKDVPHVHREWFEGRTDGLIALSAGRLGDVGQALLAGNHEQAKQHLQFWQTHFPNRFYLELQRTGRPQEEEYIHAAVQLAIETQTPVVATNDVVFLKEDDYEAHEVRVCIHDGYVLDDNRRPRIYSTQQYLRSPEEMAELFSDIPEAIENTWRIAQRCNIELTLGKNYLPDFPVPEGMTMDEYFCELSRKGLDDRFNTVLKDKVDQRQEYDERLQVELDVILQMGFPGYFLIVADFIQWSKDNDVPVGPGRGSGAGSIVAYALKITDLDPIEYDLLFERFLNPERVSMPDFDVDFCMEGRDRVIQYVAETYGKEHVSQIITFGTMAAKAVVRDVGRVLGHPYPFVDQISKLIPFEIGMTLTKALEQEEQLEQRYQNDEGVKAIIDMALKLEGLTRNVGTHAGGVVIGPSKLTDFCPLYWDGNPENTMVTQLDKNDVETIGLVKFDFLGLRTLTIIKWALENIVKVGGEAPDMLEIPLDDTAAFDLLKKAQTTAVFQLESRGMKELIKRLLPDCFEDIVALVALFRPGPLQSGMVDDFINRKHGLAEIEYPHPDLEPILKPTYGIILYQEQVMQISQVLANYTLGGADLLRRAMGKKKAEEMAKQRATFTEGALKREVKEETATYIFDLMEKFAGYGFNKCVIGSTLVANPETGELLTVKSLFKNGIKQVASLQADKKMGVSDVVQVMENGAKPVFQLTTATGKQITTTDNHPFLTMEGWKPLAELNAGQRIASPSQLPIEGKENWETSIFEDIKPHQLLPDNIFKLKNDALNIFIKNYWTKFGSLEAEKHCIQTTSKPLLHQLQHLLLRLGIVCYIKESEESNDRAYKFNLVVSATSNVQVFEAENRTFPINIPKQDLETSNTDIFWETIVSIEPAGSEMTYDLEVQETHNFVANDLIIHNSHSAAYAFVSYQTAWLKAHYPAAFMAAVLSSDMDNTDKVVGLIDDCREMKLEVKPPHVNYCDYKFTIADNQTILYGLGAIKGVGENAIESIVISRKENKEFKDLFDFCKKIDLRKVNRRVLEALVKSGCFDSMGASRATLTASLDTAIKLAEKHASDKSTGQNSLFAMFDTPEEQAEEKVPYAENVMEWTDIQRLNGEKDCLGLYLTGHPIDQYKTELKNFSYTTLSKVRPTNRGSTAKVIGLMLGVRIINSRRGKMAIIQLDDNTGRLDATMFSSVYTEVQHKLEKDAILVVEGEVREDEYSGGFTMNASNVMTFPEAREKSAKYMMIQVTEQQVQKQFTQNLLTLLQANQGRCPIIVNYQNKEAEVKLRLGGQWAVMPSDDFISQLENLLGHGKVKIEY